MNAIGVISEGVQRNLDLLNRSDTLSDTVTRVHPIWAGIFILVGIACIANGYRWHKYIVVIIAAMAGFWAGDLLAPHIGNEFIASACLGLLFAVLAWPLLRYAVALFGGLAGAFAGANLWTALDLGADQHRMGALIGLLVVGMLAFLAFRAVVILMTAIGGAKLLVLGGLAALVQIEPWRASILDGMASHPRIVPVIGASVATIGAVIQFSGGIKGMATLADKADTSKAQQKKAA